MRCQISLLPHLLGRMTRVNAKCVELLKLWPSFFPGHVCRLPAAPAARRAPAPAHTTQPPPRPPPHTTNDR